MGRFHEGELAVQRRAGAEDVASRVGRGLSDAIPADFAAFLAAQVFLVTASVDGDGRVLDTAVARSSGDAVLDAHARAVVAGWRFAVPPGYPQGFSGELPMRFGASNR